MAFGLFGRIANPELSCVWIANPPEQCIPDVDTSGGLLDTLSPSRQRLEGGKRALCKQEKDCAVSLNRMIILSASILSLRLVVSDSERRAARPLLCEDVAIFSCSDTTILLVLQLQKRVMMMIDAMIIRAKLNIPVILSFSSMF